MSTDGSNVSLSQWAIGAREAGERLSEACRLVTDEALAEYYARFEQSVYPVKPIAVIVGKPTLLQRLKWRLINI